jgi:hypothetical protein
MRCGLLLLFFSVQLANGATVPDATDLIAKLEDDDFETRQRAEAELEETGRAVVPALKKAAAAKGATLETQTRLERIVQNIALTEKLAAMLKRENGYSELVEFAANCQKTGSVREARAICERGAALLRKKAEAEPESATTQLDHAEWLESCAQTVQTNWVTLAPLAAQGWSGLRYGQFVQLDNDDTFLGGFDGEIDLFSLLCAPQVMVPVKLVPTIDEYGW